VHFFLDMKALPPYAVYGYCVVVEDVLEPQIETGTLLRWMLQRRQALPPGPNISK